MLNKAVATGKPQCILLADDDEDDVFLFQEALSETESVHKLTIARDGIEVIEVMSLPPVPDLIFLDINMPRKNGLECLAEINLATDSNEIPVICLSTSQNIDVIEHARQLGAYGYIIKPSTFKGYKSMIADVLSKDWKTRSRFDFYHYEE